MRVRMLADRKGSPDGIRVEHFRGGREYDIPDSLARVFLTELECAEVVEPEPEPEPEQESEPEHEPEPEDEETDFEPVPQSKAERPARRGRART